MNKTRNLAYWLATAAVVLAAVIVVAVNTNEKEPEPAMAGLNTNTQTEQNSWTEYRDGLGRFTLSYPSNWVKEGVTSFVEGVPTTGDGVSFLVKPNPTPPPNYYFGISIQQTDAQTCSALIEGRAADMIESGSPEDFTREMTKRLYPLTETTIGGKSTCRTTDQFQIEGGMTEHYIAIVDGWAYDVTFPTAADSNPEFILEPLKNNALAHQILESIRFW